jgi:photosystem II stability/assembly factor-like uncharacterized protein
MDRLWAASAVGLMYSRDGGTTWHTNAIAGGLGKVHFLTPLVGYATGGSLGALSTTDGGMTWSQITALQNREVEDIAAVGSRLWAVAGTVISSSTDGGAHWTDFHYQAGSTGTDFRCVRFVSPTTGWVFGLGGVILRTVDGDVTWVSEGVAMPNEYIQDAAFVNGAGWAVGGGGTILKYAGAVVVAPRPPFGRNPHVDRGRGFSASLDAEPGRTYTVQGSPDLLNWSDVTNATAAGSSLDFTDPAATNLTQRFYRSIGH